MCTRSAILYVALSLAPTLASAAPSANAVDLAALRNTAGKATCCVTVENKWGIPVAIATGFLLGDGKFVVTDLGAVACPGVQKATLTLPDGSTTAATQFGMADPALGLVALRLGAEQPSRPGLPLAAAMPPLDGTAPVASAGWRWGSQFDVVAGRVWKGPAIKDIAARVRVETPAGVDTFLRVEGGRLEAASGSPVLDASGTVLAVKLDVATRDAVVALAMPAASLRQSLLSATPELKSLSDLPKALWPVRVLRLKGEPPTLAEFAKTCQAVKAAMVCTRCKGKGKVDWGRGGWDWLGGGGDVRCWNCQGEGMAVDKENYEFLYTWAEHGTRVAWAPVMDERSRTAMRAAGAEILNTFAAAGPHFRRTYSFAGGLDAWAITHQKLPRGVVLYAQVGETVEGPDGKYVMLSRDPQNAQFQVAIREDDFTALAGKGKTARPAPAEKTWVVLAGAILSRFEGGNYKGISVLPFDWLPCPAPIAIRDEGGGRHGPPRDGPPR